MLNHYATNRLREVYPRVQEIVTQHLLPHEAGWMRQPFGQVAPTIRALRPLLQSQGVWNLYHGPELGGPGLTLVEVAQVSELLGRTPYGHFAFNCQAPDAGNVELLLKYADDSLRARYLAPLLAGELRSCFAMTEPELPGSNPVLMATTARREGNEYVIDGHKWFTTAADGAAFAIVMALTNPEATNPYERASMVIVPTDTPGFELVRNISIMGHAGEDWASHAEIRLHGVRVPVANRLGPEGAGFLLAQERLGPGRIHHCMRWIGVCERAFDLMCQRAVERTIAPGRKLADQQMVQDFVATSRAEIDAARLLVLHAAQRIQDDGAKAARREISTIKFYVAGVLQRVVDRAIQVHGALGVTDDTILAFYYREERSARIYDGPDEVHKVSLARQILKDYAAAEV